MAKIDSKEVIRVKGMGFLFNRETGDKFNARVVSENGCITAKQMSCLAVAAEKFGSGDAAFTSRMCIEIQGVSFENIEPLQKHLAEAGLATGGTGDKIRPVVACKGKTCVFGLVASTDIAKDIHKRFYEGYRGVELPHKFKIAVGGCPNNCVKPDLNDVGLVGQKKPIINLEKCKGCGKCLVESGCLMKAAKKGENGLINIDTNRCNNCGKCISACPFKCIEVKDEGVKVLIGGRWGREGRKGSYLQGIYPVEEALNIIEKIILVYRDNSFKKERFADMIDRIGFEKVESLIFESNVIERKEEIITKEILKR
ncbi:MAG: 4Fe-4S binding protein [Lachnospiraceae bacterium]|nr:4Fe-4S binding protein [Lachnospiraceae bacterium]